MTRRITDEIIEFEMMSLAEKSVDITVTFFDPMTAALKITAFVEGDEFGALYKASEKFIEAELSGIPLSAGINYLHFIISGDTSMMSIAGFELKNY